MVCYYLGICFLFGWLVVLYLLVGCGLLCLLVFWCLWFSLGGVCEDVVLWLVCLLVFVVNSLVFGLDVWLLVLVSVGLIVLCNKQLFFVGFFIDCLLTWFGLFSLAFVVLCLDCVLIYLFYNVCLFLGLCLVVFYCLLFVYDRLFVLFCFICCLGRFTYLLFMVVYFCVCLCFYLCGGLA